MSRADELKARLELAEPAFSVKGNEGRRQLMGYAGPQQRSDNCKGCLFRGHTLLDTGSWNEREVFNCKVGGFKVAAGGVCEHYEMAK